MPEQGSDQQQGGEKTQTAEISGTVQIKQPEAAQQQSQQKGQGNEASQGDQKKEEAEPKRNPLRTLIIICVVLLIVLAAGFFYWRSTFTEDTDDAQIDGNLYQVSSRVTGQVTKVYVDDNEAVQAGQLLAEIDPKDYQVALDQAKANLSAAEADAVSANTNIPITSVNTGTQVSTTSLDVRSGEAGVAQSKNQTSASTARVDQARANYAKAQLDVDRYTPLVQKDVISKQQYDAAVAQAAATRAAVIEAEAQVVAQQEATRQAQQRLAQSRSQAEQSVRTRPQQIEAQRARAASMQAQVLQARAKVEQAELNLSYTKITAPVGGIVNKKNVQVGSNLGIGQDLLTIIPLDDLWVTANFKETQLSKMKVGQEVDIKVDALGGRHFTGKLAQVGGATGSKLSLFPAENATGNYVKVVQRIPVRIDLTNLKQENKDHALRPGFSVTPDVHIK